jgi:hypothetical protein
MEPVDFDGISRMIGTTTLRTLAKGILVFGQTVILFLGLFSEPVHPQTYDALVAMIGNDNSSVRVKGKTKLARTIKETMLKGELDPDQATEDTFCFGHFVNPTALDLAVGISTIPYGGNLIVLAQRNGHYVPLDPVTGIGHIESIEAVRLLHGQYDQLSLNLYGGGSGFRHWANDIYCWDGKTIRMIWAWLRKEVYEQWQPGSRREYTGHVIQSTITIGSMRNNSARDIITSTVIENGVFDPRTSSVLSTVTSKNEEDLVHRWDQSLFFYVARHGRILPDKITVSCKKGIPQKEGSVALKQGTRIGVIDMPGFFQPDAEHYATVIGKEHFCEIPKSAVKLLD